MAVNSSTSYPKLVALPTIAAERVLALDCARLLAPAGPIPLEGVAHHRFAELNAALLAGLAPSVVIMPLFSTDQDAMSMVEALETLGFAGRIIVVAPALPRPKLVERELRALGPAERLTLVTP